MVLYSAAASASIVAMATAKGNKDKSAVKYVWQHLLSVVLLIWYRRSGSWSRIRFATWSGWGPATPFMTRWRTRVWSSTKAKHPPLVSLAAAYQLHGSPSWVSVISATSIITVISIIAIASVMTVSIITIILQNRNCVTSQLRKDKGAT